MRVRAPAAVFVATAVTTAASAWAPAARAEALTSTADVRACLPRDDGAVVAATTGGLALVKDGKVVRTLTSLDGLPDTKVNALLADGAEVWAGTDRGAVALEIKGTQATVLRSFPSAPVLALARQGGATFAGTLGDGLLKLGATSGPPSAIAFAASTGPLARRRVTALASFDGTLWAGTAGAGLLRLLDGKLVAVSATGVPSSVGALGAHDGRLWIGGVEGVASLGKGGLDVHPEGTQDVRAIASIGGEVLLGGFGAGLLHPGKGGLVGVAATPKGVGSVQAIAASGTTRCLGATTGLWVAQGGGGYQPVTSEGPPGNDVSALARTGDRLWVGTYDRGLAVLENGVFRRVSAPGLDDRINVLVPQVVDGKQKLWVATTRGLALVDTSSIGAGTGPIVLGASGTKAPTIFGEASGMPASDVHALAPLAAGGVIMGTAKGAALLQGGQVTPLGKKQGIGIDAVWAVAEASDGTLFLGTSAGLYYRRPKEGWLRLSHLAGQLQDDWVTALVVRGGSVLVGTYSGGVTRLTLPAMGAKGAPQVEHLGGGFVNLGGLSVVSDTLYAATMEGMLSRPVDGAASWKKHPKASPGVDVTAVIPAGEGLWVASRRGIARYKP